MRSYLAEFLGTFTLVFIGTAVATISGFPPGFGGAGWLGISFAFGFTLVVLVLVIGPVSGCHINPAVSLAMVLAKRLPAGKLPGYVIALLAGATGASFVLLVLLLGMPGFSVAEQGLGENGNPRGIATARSWAGRS